MDSNAGLRSGNRYASTADAADAEALYRLLEEEIVPAFYDRDANKVPQRWLWMVKEAIRTTMPRFSARRMVKQYAEWLYAPGLSREQKP